MPEIFSLLSPLAIWPFGCNIHYPIIMCAECFYNNNIQLSKSEYMNNTGFHSFVGKHDKNKRPNIFRGYRIPTFLEMGAISFLSNITHSHIIPVSKTPRPKTSLYMFQYDQYRSPVWLTIWSDQIHRYYIVEYIQSQIPKQRKLINKAMLNVNQSTMDTTVVCSICRVQHVFLGIVLIKNIKLNSIFPQCIRYCL